MEQIIYVSLKLIVFIVECYHSLHDIDGQNSSLHPMLLHWNCEPVMWFILKLLFHFHENFIGGTAYCLLSTFRSFKWTWRFHNIISKIQKEPVSSELWSRAYTFQHMQPLNSKARFKLLSYFHIPLLCQSVILRICISSMTEHVDNWIDCKLDKCSWNGSHIF